MYQVLVLIVGGSTLHGFCYDADGIRGSVYTGGMQILSLYLPIFNGAKRRMVAAVCAVLHDCMRTGLQRSYRPLTKVLVLIWLVIKIHY